MKKLNPEDRDRLVVALREFRPHIEAHMGAQDQEIGEDFLYHLARALFDRAFSRYCEEEGPQLASDNPDVESEVVGLIVQVLKDEFGLDAVSAAASERMCRDF